MKDLAANLKSALAGNAAAQRACFLTFDALTNDKSVLENHHVAAFFRTMIDNECNILQNLSKQEYKQFRSLMVELVLHTDMSLHFSQIKNLKNLLQTASAGGR